MCQEENDANRGNYQTGADSHGYSGYYSLGLFRQRTADCAKGEPGDGTRVAGHPAAGAGFIAAPLGTAGAPGAFLRNSARSQAGFFVRALPTLPQDN